MRKKKVRSVRVPRLSGEAMERVVGYPAQAPFNTIHFAAGREGLQVTVSVVTVRPVSNLEIIEMVCHALMGKPTLR